MKINNKIVSSPPVACDIYYEKFRQHVFMLLFEGYTRVRTENLSLTKAEEDEITAYIVKGIDEYKKDPHSPSWVNHYQVQEQRPHSPHGEIGKKRKWLDIFFQGNRKERNNTFCFESKRLYPRQVPAEYFGQHGMQRFLSGEYPINSKGEAVMVGYVQSHDTSQWLQWLKINFEDYRAELHVPPDSTWDDCPIIPQIKHSFQTRHTPLPNAHIVLFHLLLSFT